MIFHIDGVLIIGRISQIPSWWNIECKVTIFFANTQILVYLCSIFWLKTKKYGNYTHVDIVTKNNKNYLLKKQLKQLSRQSNSTPFAHEAHRGPRISWRDRENNT